MTVDRVCFVDCGKSAPECHCKRRDLAVEYQEYRRMILATSEVSQEYNKGKMKIEDVEPSDG